MLRTAPSFRLLIEESSALFQAAGWALGRNKLNPNLPGSGDGDGDDDDVVVDDTHLDLLMVRVEWGENTYGALVHLRQIQI